MTSVTFTANAVGGFKSGLKYLRQFSCCLMVLLSCSALMADETTVDDKTAVDSGDNKLELSIALEVRGLEPALIRGAIRFSFGRSNSISQLPELLSCLGKGVERLRQLAGTE